MPDITPTPAAERQRRHRERKRLAKDVMRDIETQRKGARP